MATLYENFTTGDNGRYAPYGANYYAQTFTPSTSHAAYSVKLKLEKYLGSPTATLTASIRATDVNGKPTGSDLCSGTLDTSTVVATALYEIIFTTAYVLAASTKYAIVVKCPDAPDTDVVGWRANSSGGYTDGDARNSSDSGATWGNAIGSVDFLFEDWGFPTEVSGTTTHTPTLAITYVDTITRIAATAHVHLADIGTSAVTQKGVCWNTTGTPTTSDSKTTEGAGTEGNFTSIATVLVAGTKYYIRAYATNTTGTGYSDQVEITTASGAPIVTTQQCSAVATTTATGNGNITSIGDGAVSEHGHCWNTAGTPTTADSKTTNGAGVVGAFTSSITGLTGGTTYYVRAYATNAYGTSYGAQVTMLPSASNVVPTVTTQAVSEIIPTGCKGNGTVSSLGIPASILQHGHCWSSSTTTPTTSDSKTELGTKSSTGTFTSVIGSLTEGTIYYVRAYATNQTGTAYGDTVLVTPKMVSPGGGGVPVYPILDTARVTTIIHRFGRGIYNLELGIGGLDTSIGVPKAEIRAEESYDPYIRKSTKVIAQDVTEEMLKLKKIYDELMAKQAASDIVTQKGYLPFGKLELDKSPKRE